MYKYLFILLLSAMAIVGCSNTQTLVAPPPSAKQEPTINEAEIGKKAVEEKDYEKAVQAYSNWLIKNPKDEEVLFDRGRANFHLKQYDAASQDFEASALINPKNLRVQVHQARLWIVLNQKEKAKNLLQMAKTDASFSLLNPYEKFLVFYMEGQLYNMVGEYDKALAPLDEAIQIHSLSPNTFEKEGMPYIQRFAIYHKAVANYNINHYKKAAQDMQEYIELSQKAQAEVTSKDYQSLVLAYYLANDIETCKSYLSHLSPEDRKELHTQFADNLFLQD